MNGHDRVRNWRARAEELRTLADQMQLADTRNQLLKMAGDLERMAERAEINGLPATPEGSEEQTGHRGPRRRPFLTPT